MNTAIHNQSLATLTNPFRSNVVKDAWQAIPSDVPGIHQSGFRRCIEAIEHAERAQGHGVLLYGSPGAGKTHLLSRLRTHLSRAAASTGDRVLRCIFVSVRLNTHATELWSHVRRVLVNDLLRENQGISQLQRLVAHQVAAARGESPNQWVMTLRVLSDLDRDTIVQCVESVAERLQLDPSVTAAFRCLATRDRTRDAAAWLRGDAVDNEALEGLSIPRVEAEQAEPRAVVAQRVVTSICRLAGEKLPIVFCFDQIEALEPNDRSSLSEFARMASELCDADPNVALISSIQTSWLEPVREIPQALQDRVFAVREALGELEKSEIRSLLAAKLATVPEIAELAPAGTDRSIYPFDSAFIDELGRLTHRVPRRVLVRAAERFDELRFDHAAPRTRTDEERVEALLPEALERARSRAEPLDSVRETLLHGLPILGTLVGPEPQRAATLPPPANGAAKPTASGDAVVQTTRGPVSIILSDERDMRASWRKLQRILEQLTSGQLKAERTVVVRPASMPIPQSAKGTRERVDAIIARGVRFEEPTSRALAALEALRVLVSEVRSGDLGDRDGPLPPRGVVDWLRAHLDPELEELAQSLGIGVEAPVDGEPPNRQVLSHLRELLSAHGVVSAERLQEELSLDVDAIVDLAARHPDHVGLLGGPPAVLFALVGGEINDRAVAP